MKHKLLLLTAIIGLSTMASASADSGHKTKDNQYQQNHHVEHHGHEPLNTHNKLFSFSVILPRLQYYSQHHHDGHHDYRHQHKHHENNKHHNRHNQRHTDGYRSHRG